MTKEQKEIKRLRITAQQIAVGLMCKDTMMRDAIITGIESAPEFVQIFDQEWDVKASQKVFKYSELHSPEVPTKAEWFVYNWQHGMLGSFYSLLAQTIQKADSMNTENLRRGFPLEVEGMTQYANTEGWWDMVQVKVAEFQKATSQTSSQGDPKETE